ncbi:MAG: hypothetical protein IJT16_07965 [Lachnospiraceae bacterium]|nr:hypothetical protein [Lachnospiraceae bacterium]
MTKKKDKITGFIGTVTGKAEYYDGRRTQYLVEGIDSTGRPVEWWFDEDRLEDV